MEAHGLSDGLVLGAGSAPRSATVIACRVLDVIVAALLLVLLIPVLLAAAIAIKFDSPGPVLFRQLRVGRGGRLFRVNKLRTMRSNASPAPHHAYVAALIAGEAGSCDGSERPLYKLGRDDRVTGVGRFLRRWSIDELPQLYNVLTGDMSLVGPRPAIPYELDHYEHDWHRRFSVRPGMTGLWQVSGRNELTFADMMRLDVAYADQWGLRRNVLILARTARVVVQGRGT
jgi:lipopolysaccharide/colanic/teichoic acid biosynthesis glycosyltransferase